MAKVSQRITPFLWFDDQAEQAASFYVSLFEDSKLLATTRYGDSGPRPAGSVMTLRFRLAGQEFVALNGGPVYQPTPAISFVVNCADQAEIDSYWKKLTAGGEAVRCGWLTDKFGVSWQVVPEKLQELLTGDAAAANRVMTAIMGMVKLDLAALERAHAGK